MQSQFYNKIRKVGSHTQSSTKQGWSKVDNLNTIKDLAEKIEKRKSKITEISKVGQKGYSWGKDCKDQFDANLHKAIGKKFKELFSKEKEEQPDQNEITEGQRKARKFTSQEEESIERLAKQIFK